MEISESPLMKAVMLAAGLGSRLEQDEKFPPKVLLRFGGVSLLERHIRILSSLGIDEMVIGVGYNRDMIDDELINMTIKRNLDLSVWTVNNTKYYFLNAN